MTGTQARRLVVFFAALALGLAADLVTKHWAFATLGMPGEYAASQSAYWLIDGVAGFQTSLNQGGLFGMGQGAVHWLAAFSFVAILGILGWLFFFGALESRFLPPVLGMISAGVLGNLYDRLGLHGLRWNYPDEFHGFFQIGDPVYAVRDWILVMLGSYHWPNFNIADAMLVCGAILLGIYLVCTGDPKSDVKSALESGPESGAETAPKPEREA